MVTTFEGIVRTGLLLFCTLACTGCYQIHSDDDLRSVPVTNNPTLIPRTLSEQVSIGPFMTRATAGDRDYARGEDPQW